MQRYFKFIRPICGGADIVMCNSRGIVKCHAQMRSSANTNICARCHFCDSTLIFTQKRQYTKSSCFSFRSVFVLLCVGFYVNENQISNCCEKWNPIWPIVLFAAHRAMRNAQTKDSTSPRN